METEKIDINEITLDEKALEIVLVSKKLYFVIKRVFDAIFALLVLLLLAPLLAIIGIIIRFHSKGPIFFRQERVGKGGKNFVMYKFRTMYCNVPKYAPTPVTREDERVTKVGRFLRRTSLDELPQFVNVLKGEMSLVGPRPEQPFIVAQYEPWQRQRLLTYPGITGLWQVSGRSNLSLEDMTKLDIFYLENQSLFLDLRILFQTLPAVVSRKGAY